MNRENKKETVASLFLAMFLRATVIITGLMIVVFSVVYVVKLFERGNKNDAKSTSASSEIEDTGVDELLGNTATVEATEGGNEATTEASLVDATSSKIAVLNSTEITGLAGAWCENLNAKGYADCTPSDFSEPYTNTRIVAKLDGVGKELVSYFAGATYEVGTLTTGSEEDLTQYDIVIIIGTSDNIVAEEEQ